VRPSGGSPGAPPKLRSKGANRTDNSASSRPRCSNEELPHVRRHETALGLSRNARRSDGVQSYCTECRRKYMRRHYARNAAKYRASAAVRNERRRAAIRRIIRDAKDRPCSDCGVRYPVYVMDFDHREADRKRFNIGRDALSGPCSEEALKGEIEKCDVVCANCHRLRTHGQRAKLGRQDSNLD
jgi:hypothetical protein